MSQASHRRKPSEAQIEHIYQLYPRKVGKTDAKKAISKALSWLVQETMTILQWTWTKP